MFLQVSSKSSGLFQIISVMAPEEVEQRLTILADGRVWLSRYCFGDTYVGHALLDKQNFSIPKAEAREILNAVSEYFSNEPCIELATDSGSWDLTLLNTAGQKYKTIGSLCYDLQTEHGGLSDLIRAKLNRKDLFLFDGNPDVIDKIDIQYYRNIKIKPRVKPEGATWEYVTWDYNERLLLDRTAETIEHFRKIGSGCSIKSVYNIEAGVSSFLDDIDVNVFSEVKGNPPDTVENPLEIKDYVITLETKHGIVRTVKGTYDKNGLPTDWPDFISSLFDFIDFYGLGEIFNPHIYGKAKRRQSDFIFCNVIFEEGGRTYCYLADSDDFKAGDLVVVPAGRDNHETIARIESIEYHTAEESPFPVEKTKHILRKYKKDLDKHFE